LETARISWIATEVAHAHSWLLENDEGCATIELLLTLGVVDYELPVVSAIYDRCEGEVLRRCWSGESYAGPHF
jgi:hypothetical protein